MQGTFLCQGPGREGEGGLVGSPSGPLAPRQTRPSRSMCCLRWAPRAAWLFIIKAEVLRGKTRGWERSLLRTRLQLAVNLSLIQNTDNLEAGHGERALPRGQRGGRPGAESWPRTGTREARETALLWWVPLTTRQKQGHWKQQLGNKKETRPSPWVSAVSSLQWPIKQI